MPTYDLKHIPTGEVKEHFVSIGTMTEMVESGEYEIVHKKSGGFISENGDIFHKMPSGYNDLLKSIKKGSGRSNTIKTK